MHIFHKWSKWSEEKTYNMVAIYYDGDKVPYQERRQHRICGKCGKIEERTLS